MQQIFDSLCCFCSQRVVEIDSHISSYLYDEEHNQWCEFSLKVKSKGGKVISSQLCLGTVGKSSVALKTLLRVSTSQ